MTSLGLDRPQRDALRRELALRVGVATGDLAQLVEEGDRGDVLAAVVELRRITETLDLVGWADPEDAPDFQPIDTPTEEVRAYARIVAEAVVQGAWANWPDATVMERDLDATSAAWTIAGTPGGR